MFRRGLIPSTKALTFRKMSQRVFLDTSPPTYCGDKGTLEKSAFQKSLQVLAAQFPAAQTNIMLKAVPLKWYRRSHRSKSFDPLFLTRSIMDLPKVRSVVVDPSDPLGGRLILLRVSTEGTECSRYMRLDDSIDQMQVS
jgi:tRNA (guanine37-N1)-methyltransferase